MFFLVTGASGSGKSACLPGIRELLPDLAVHDFDSIGVPPGATATWRLEADEIWLKRAIEYQVNGKDMLLAGQSPLGEILSCPSALEITGIAACLVDCIDSIRRQRLNLREGEYGPEFSTGPSGNDGMRRIPNGNNT